MSYLSGIADLAGRPSQKVVTARSASAAFLGLLLSLEVEAGDEVILPVSICQTLVNAVLLTGATPVLADCGEAFQLDADALSRRLSKRTRVVLFHHAFGRASDLTPVRTVLTDRADVLVVEDCAQAPGAALAGRTTGQQGDVALFSFGPAKPLNAGVGGALVGEARLVGRVELALRVGRRGWPDDVQLGIDSTLTEGELKRLVRAVETYPRRIRRRVAKVSAALGQPVGKAEVPPPNVFHRLVLDLGDRDHADLAGVDPELWQPPSPATPPYAATFLGKRYEAIGRMDLWDPGGHAFPVWRRLAARSVLVRTGPDVPRARLKAFCRALDELP